MEKQRLLPGYGSILTDDDSNATTQQKRRQIPPGPQTSAIPEVGKLLIGEAVRIDAQGNATIKRATLWDPSNPPKPEIRNGLSLDKEGISEMIRNTQRSKVVAITIRNYRKQRLEKIHVFTKKGATQRAQQSVAQQTAEAFIASNSRQGVSTKGIASYLAKMGVYINIYWSVSLFSSKRLGIQITKKKPSGEKDFNDFNGLSIPHKESDCIVKEYKKLLTEGEVKACGLRVTCTMANDSKTEALIEVFDI